ncbi:hypothetical protein CspeluHIS016_0109770 [Cutaneotrichosporon spelunceum]|uniref:Uncharacterized protein n=1 Tax=Cutaneotrichosporon spelunceum TaxID=1672016 RepID=A0AAD3TQ02_9TREE|nr:hypothetical protein CspeluHIS016_0109770 [Cutaneotrichosporon spelunceum]
MSYNYSHVIGSLEPAPACAHTGRVRAGPSELAADGRASPLRPAAAREPVLLQPLPPSTVFEKEGAAQSELELDRQTVQRRRERDLAEALQDAQFRVERIAAREQMGTRTKKETQTTEVEEERRTAPFVRPPEAYELYRAIDKKDLDFIARVRDHAFHMLLQKNAAEFPVVYAARIGPSHRDVLILLVGAFSRYVNQFEEDDFANKEVQNTLKMLRANLKLAIDNALLPQNQPHLLSSYLQVLIMSEGDAWIHKTAHDLGLLLRDPATRPVAEAEALVRRFATRELRSVPGGVADVEEYVWNATLDLVIMAAWSVAAGQIDADNLPTYTFARDLRTLTQLTEAMDANAGKMGRVNRRVRSILDAVRRIAPNTLLGMRARVAELRAAIDGDGGGAANANAA